VGSGVAEGSAAVSPIAGAGVPFPVAAGVPHAARTRIRALINNSARISHSIEHRKGVASLLIPTTMPRCLFHVRPFSPCGRRGQGGMRGKRARECPRIPPSEVRAPPARTGATPALPAHTSGARASGAYPGRDAPAPQGLPRAQGGLQPAPSPVSGIRMPNPPFSPCGRRRLGDEGQTRTGMRKTTHPRAPP